MSPEPSRIVASPDGVPIALFDIDPAPPDASARKLSERDPDPAAEPRSQHPTLVLVHGTTADHTTFRAIGPELARTRPVVAIDRRGRGASGDGLDRPYSIEREFDDLAAVARSLSTLDGGPVDVLGHSYGGRVALGAALRSGRIGRLVVYEGAPSSPGKPYRPRGLEDRIRSHLDHGANDLALETFFREVVGMDDAAIADYRANPVWPTRVAAAGTVLRELEAEASPGGSMAELGGVAQPVLLILGSASREPFAAATSALAGQLRDGRVVTIEGAAHAAHHTHVAEMVAAVEAFLDA